MINAINCRKLHENIRSSDLMELDQQTAKQVYRSEKDRREEEEFSFIESFSLVKLGIVFVSRRLAECASLATVLCAQMSINLAIWELASSLAAL